MDKQLENFLNDLIVIIQEKYNDSLDSVVTENFEDKAFRLGSNFAYYDVLSIIELQLAANQMDLKNMNPISPTLGKKI